MSKITNRCQSSYPVNIKLNNCKTNYGGNKCVFRWERNFARQVKVRNSRGSEFHTVGAEKEKEHLPNEERRSGTVSKWRLTDRKARPGRYGVSRSDRYEGMRYFNVLKNRIGNCSNLFYSELTDFKEWQPSSCPKTIESREAGEFEK